MDDKTFLAALFDTTFSSFITTRIVKVLFLLQIGLAALGVLFLVVAGFTQGFLAGVFALLIVAPLSFLLWVLMIRVQLELVLVVFRIAENTAKAAEAVRKPAASA